MKKVFKMQDLDCAMCAEKMRARIAKLDGVQFVSVDFMSQRMTIEAEEKDFDALMDEIKRICKKIEPDCKIVC